LHWECGDRHAGSRNVIMIYILTKQGTQLGNLYNCRILTCSRGGQTPATAQCESVS
jgi:hypothetical protein